MTPTAISQVIEALGKLVIGLLLAAWAIKNGYSIPEAAAFAVMGLTIGVAISMMYLVITKIFFKSREKSAVSDISDSLKPEGRSAILCNLVR